MLYIFIPKHNIYNQIKVHIYSTHRQKYYSPLLLYRRRKYKRTEKTVRQIVTRTKKPAIIKAIIAAVRHLLKTSGEQSETMMDVVIVVVVVVTVDVVEVVVVVVTVDVVEVVVVVVVVVVGITVDVVVVKSTKKRKNIFFRL